MFWFTCCGIIFDFSLVAASVLPNLTVLIQREHFVLKRWERVIFKTHIRAEKKKAIHRLLLPPESSSDCLCECEADAEKRLFSFCFQYCKSIVSHPYLQPCMQDMYGNLQSSPTHVWKAWPMVLSSSKLLLPHQ